jgi:hypothetical protein
MEPEEDYSDGQGQDVEDEPWEPPVTHKATRKSASSSSAIPQQVLAGSGVGGVWKQLGDLAVSNAKMYEEHVRYTRNSLTSVIENTKKVAEGHDLLRETNDMISQKIPQQYRNLKDGMERLPGVLEGYCNSIGDRYLDTISKGHDELKAGFQQAFAVLTQETGHLKSGLVEVASEVTRVRDTVAHLQKAIADTEKPSRYSVQDFQQLMSLPHLQPPPHQPYYPGASGLPQAPSRGGGGYGGGRDGNDQNYLGGPGKAGGAGTPGAVYLYY